MSRTHLSSNTLLLWFSLSAAAAACSMSVGCSSSDSSGTPAAAGKGGNGHTGGATGKGGSDSGSEAGEAATGGVPDETGDPDETGGSAPSSGGKSAGGGGKAAGGSTSAGGSSPTGAAGETGEGGAGGSPDMEDPEVAAAQARALALIAAIPKDTERCTTCHQDNFAGAGFFANITPDVETGIGSWSEDEIKIAIRDGKDKDGAALCATMIRYTFTEAQLSDLAVFLKHLPAVKKKISQKCP